MAIPFTQYLLPDGRRTLIYIDLDEDTEAKANKIIERGHCFEAETLRDYTTVSFTIGAIDRNEPDVDIVLCKNGPDVPVKITEMINRFYEKMEKNND